MGAAQEVFDEYKEINNNNNLFGLIHKIKWMLDKDKFLLWIVYDIMQWTNVQLHMLFVYYMWLQQLKIKKLILKKRAVSYTWISITCCHLLGTGRRQCQRKKSEIEYLSLLIITFLLCNSLWVSPLIFEPKFISGPHNQVISHLYYCKLFTSQILGHEAEVMEYFYMKMLELCFILSFLYGSFYLQRKYVLH